MVVSGSIEGFQQALPAHLLKYLCMNNILNFYTARKIFCRMNPVTFVPASALNGQKKLIGFTKTGVISATGELASNDMFMESC